MYIGKSINPIKRLKQHLADKSSKRLAKAIRADGKDKFQLYVIAEFKTDLEVSVAELLFIDQLGTDDPDLGYNGLTNWKYISKEIRKQYRKKKYELSKSPSEILEILPIL